MIKSLANNHHKETTAFEFTKTICREESMLKFKGDSEAYTLKWDNKALLKVNNKDKSSMWDILFGSKK